MENPVCNTYRIKKILAGFGGIVTNSNNLFIMENKGLRKKHGLFERVAN